MNTAIEEEQAMCRLGSVPEPDRLREFALAALSHDAVDDAVTELLFEHVVEGRYHPSVIAAELPRLLEEVAGAATLTDWQALAGLLVSEQGSAAQAAQSGGGERRVTALGTRIDVGLIREFLWMALTHPAAATRLLRQRSTRGRTTPTSGRLRLRCGGPSRASSGRWAKTTGT